jgi:hypothetical protein
VTDRGESVIHGDGFPAARPLQRTDADAFGRDQAIKDLGVVLWEDFMKLADHYALKNTGSVVGFVSEEFFDGFPIRQIDGQYHPDASPATVIKQGAANNHLGAVLVDVFHVREPRPIA